MAGGGGGVADYHRKKHKRELQKNKEQRLAARDAKVKETKTVASVQEEIRNIERQYKNKEVRPHNIQSKLDRLNKELKIVQEEENAKKKAQSATTSQHPTKNSEPAWKPLENPALSIYFDAVLNPFGEPPPGKPRMFHTRLGGTTMNIHEAGLPGQPPPPPPPPPPRNQTEPSAHDMKKDTSVHRDESRSRGSDDQTFGQERERAPIPRKASASTKKAPPQPLLTAQRPKRYGKRTPDIWASNDEMDDFGDGQDADPSWANNPNQQQTQTNTDQDRRQAPPTTPNEQWYYQDQSGQVQGPFSSTHMLQWIAAGFFPAHQLVRSSAAGAWSTLQEISVLRNSLPSTNSETTKSNNEFELESVQDRIAALCESHKSECKEVTENILHGSNSNGEQPEASAQGRIHALKQALVPESVPTSKDAPDSVEVRMAALEDNEDHTTTTTNNGTESHSDLVARRIAALRAEHLSQHGGNHAGSPEICSVSDRGNLAEVRYPNINPSNDIGPTVGDKLDVPYPISEADMADVPYPVPNEAGMADVPYPVPDGECEDSSDIAYPICDVSAEGQDINYYGVLDDYPVINSYPVVDQYPGAGDSNDHAPKEAKLAKKAKVDKEVVSLLPSHLRKRRRA